MDVLLEAKNLTKHFPVMKGLIFSKELGAVKAVDDITFTIRKGETFGLVGESGCGKSTTAKLILLLEKMTRGSLYFKGSSVENLTREELKKYRASVQAVLQDPYGSLSPRMRVGDIIAEPLVVNKMLHRKEIKAKVADILSIVGLGKERARDYPHEFSGGQRQRIALARALILNPSLIVLDEPVSALDVSIRAQMMNLLKDIQELFGLTYLIIAHDLAVLKHMCNRIGVMYLGKLVEIAESDELFKTPFHPYTQALYSAALPSNPNQQREEIILSGEVPSPFNPPSGCRFHPRCFKIMPICSLKEPPLWSIEGEHAVACHQYI